MNYKNKRLDIELSDEFKESRIRNHKTGESMKLVDLNTKLVKVLFLFYD